MTHNQPLSSRVALDRLRLLVIASEPEVRTTMVSALQACGAEVIAVGSAQAGLAAVEQQRPDIMISDLHLPDSDGYALMNKVKRLISKQSLEQVPAIAVSASAREVDLDRAVSVGFRRYVSKPIRPTRLIKLVARLAGRELAD